MSAISLLSITGNLPSRIARLHARRLTDTVAGVVGLAPSGADDRVAVAGAEVETISARTGAWNASERSFDVVAVSCHATVVSAQSAFVVVYNDHSRVRNYDIIIIIIIIFFNNKLTIAANYKT